MPGHIINLNPDVTPVEYFEKNQEQLGIVPDGTGLQILFKIKGEYYIIAGPRANQILTVFGGAIENKQVPFAAQLVEEVGEEAHPVKLERNEKGYELTLIDGSKHILTMRDDHAFLMNKVGKYAYVTFTAVCETVTLEQLKALAAELTPTAKLWNKIGNYLFTHTRKAPKDGTFVDYWQSTAEERAGKIAEFITAYKDLIAAGSPLFVDPKAVFNVKTVEEAFNKLNEIRSHEELMIMFKHTVGRFSERNGYQVFLASELARVAQPETLDKTVRDISGQVVTDMGIFNTDVVAAVIPALLREAAPSVVPFSFLAAASAANPAAASVAANPAAAPGR